MSSILLEFSRMWGSLTGKRESYKEAVRVRGRLKLKRLVNEIYLI